MTGPGETVETDEDVEILGPGTVVAIVDPLCGWCWGAAPALVRLATSGAPLLLLASGLFIGDRPMTAEFADYAWKNDRRIADLTGQIFSDVYRQKVLGDFEAKFDSGPATLALAATQLRAPDRAVGVLHGLQAARFVEGRDVTVPDVCAAVMRAEGVDEDTVAAFLAEDEPIIDVLNQRADLARQLMAHAGVRGVPAVLRVTEKGLEKIESRLLFEDVDALLAAATGTAGTV